MKIALGIEYAGYNYYGWQTQSISPTIQETLESALVKIADSAVRVHCAGRTDTGVHAVQQVVHFETNSVRDTHAWVLGTNAILPNDISVTWASNVAEDFHARFSAERRTYQYVILNRQARPAILNGLVTWECRALDFEKMQHAAEDFIGEHDFTSYRAVSCQANSPIRTIYEMKLQKFDDYIIMTICANAFLHHMVRNLAGVLLAIGRQKKPVNWASEVMAAKDRRAGGVTAPPDGLYLVNIQYPKRFNIQNPKTLTEKLGIVH